MALLGGIGLHPFHDFDISGDQVKASIVGFFNFPDMVPIPWAAREKRSVETGFFHDIKWIQGG